MKVALRPLSILDRAYQRGDVVDTRDLSQHRVNQLKRYGMLKEFDDAETNTEVRERLAVVESRLATLEAEAAIREGEPQASKRKPKAEASP